MGNLRMAGNENARKLGGRQGSAIVEASLLIPWMAFLFVGILDFGFYAYSAISIQNAARAAALRTSGSQYSFSSAGGCTAALGELRGLPNILDAVWPCDALPVIVSVRILDDTTTPACADCGVKPTATSVEATVTYQTMPMIPIPGLVMGQMTMTRIAESRVLIR